MVRLFQLHDYRRGVACRRVFGKIRGCGVEEACGDQLILKGAEPGRICDLSRRPGAVGFDIAPLHAFRAFVNGVAEDVGGACGDSGFDQNLRLFRIRDRIPPEPPGVGPSCGAKLVYGRIFRPEDSARLRRAADGRAKRPGVRCGRRRAGAGFNQGQIVASESIAATLVHDDPGDRLSALRPFGRRVHIDLHPRLIPPVRSKDFLHRLHIAIRAAAEESDALRPFFLLAIKR